MESQDLRSDVRDLINGQKLAVLATHHLGAPHGSLMAFAVTADLRRILFATMRSTRKFSNIQADARVALVIDNRSNDEADFHEAIAVTAVGKVSEIADQDIERLTAIFLSKHPYLQDFLSSPSCVLLKMDVDKYSVVKRFQNVSELIVD